MVYRPKIESGCAITPKTELRPVWSSSLGNELSSDDRVLFMKISALLKFFA
jgi:hypothetical protein